MSESPEPAGGSGSSSEILLYETEDCTTKIEVRLEGETVWLTQRQMADLFQTSVPNINIHIGNVFEEGELPEEGTIKEYLIFQPEGNRQVSRKVAHYNLDVIISVGYRVKSHRGTQFRIWATQRLREYLVKGFTLDDQRLMEGGERTRRGSSVSIRDAGISRAAALRRDRKSDSALDRGMEDATPRRTDSLRFKPSMFPPISPADDPAAAKKDYPVKQILPIVLTKPACSIATLAGQSRFCLIFNG